MPQTSPIDPQAFGQADVCDCPVCRSTGGSPEYKQFLRDTLCDIVETAGLSYEQFCRRLRFGERLRLRWRMDEILRGAREC